MLAFEEARKRILEKAASFGEELVSLESSLNRVLQEDIYADRDYPPFNRSAMDGYAIRYSDWVLGISQYEQVETIFPGEPPTKELGEGQCFRIMTGAAVPAPADTVIRVEDSVTENGVVSFQPQDLKPGQNISRQGEDIGQSGLILKAPLRITPPVIALLAAVGKTTVKVSRKPTVAVLTTGNEVINPQDPVSPYQIRNSNQFQLQALLQSMGLAPFFVGHAQDDPAELKAMLQKAWPADVLLTCGAVSAGDADFIPVVMKEMGAEELFHKVAIRPGKPIWVGMRAGKMSFCLPGNPLSCLTDFLLFVHLFIQASYGLPHEPHSIPIGFERTRRTDLDEFFPIRIDRANHTAEKISFNGSGDITASLFADAIGHHPVAKKELHTGDAIEMFPIY